MQRIRYVALVAVAFTLLGALLMFGVGAAMTIKAASILCLGERVAALPETSDRFDQTTVTVLQSVDAFLIALALMVLTVGIYSLLIGPVEFPGEKERWEWLRINSLTKLKQVLVDVIVVVLAVWFTKHIFSVAEFSWTDLVLPASILLIAVAVRD
jgi:uncharacterized membrane protein YqhA